MKVSKIAKELLYRKVFFFVHAVEVRVSKSNRPLNLSHCGLNEIYRNGSKNVKLKMPLDAPLNHGAILESTADKQVLK